VNKERSATGPDNPGKIPGPEEPVAGTMPDAGEKLLNGEPGARVPEEKPGPGTNATRDIPALSDSSTSGTGEQTQDNQPGPAGVKI
jgi:hypothetical protein